MRVSSEWFLFTQELHHEQGIGCFRSLHQFDRNTSIKTSGTHLTYPTLFFSHFTEY